MKLERITGFRLVSHDPDTLTRFYEALGFEADGPRPIEPAELAVLGLAGVGRRRPLRLGDARLDLDRYERFGRPYPSDANAASLCFQHLALVTGDVMSIWSRALDAGAVTISRDGPVTLPANAGGVTTVKLRDPEGHPLELIHFPDMAAKGWPGAGVLGIDHSAISVSDAARSEAFYRGLGLVRGKPTLNHGSTQVALDGLDGVRVDVVPMHPAVRRPHVELLHYDTPRGASCGPWASNDVAATRTVWQGGAPALLRDPDGHLHQIA